jgi:hypothetical protein
MQVVLLRVGIDSGSGGIQGPLFKDGSFEFIPIVDGRGECQDTYGNTTGVHGRKLLDYFPDRLRGKRRDLSILILNSKLLLMATRRRESVGFSGSSPVLCLSSTLDWTSGLSTGMQVSISLAILK